MAEIVAATAAATSNVLSSIGHFVSQTGKLALAGTILPLMMMVCLRLSVDDVADTYYGKDRLLVPPVWKQTIRGENVIHRNIGNVTAVPYRLGDNWLFAVPPPGSLSPWKLWFNWSNAIFLYYSYFARVLMLHKSSKGGKTAAFIVTLGLTLARGSLWQKEFEYNAEEGKWSPSGLTNVALPVDLMNMMAFPTIFAVSYFFSGGDRDAGKGLKATLVLFAIGTLEAAAIFIIGRRLTKLFFGFGAATSNFTRALIRLGIPLVLKGFFIECCSRWTPFLSRILETEPRVVSVALFAPVGCAADLYARIMQSSGKCWALKIYALCVFYSHTTHNHN